MTTTILDPLIPLTRDLRRAAESLTIPEARYLVDYYYTIQDDRTRADRQMLAMAKTSPDAEPHELINWVSENTLRLEHNIRGALDTFSSAMIPGRWAKSIVGVGPVIAAGLLAHVDVAREPTCGSLWRFAGLDPTQVWDKGQKRPFNARLKTLCWKIGESFVKVSNNPRDIYGKVYSHRKEFEIQRNDAGDLADQAATKLATVRIGKDTEAYKAYSQGLLPPGHIHARAKRYAVKLFLAHYHHVAYEYHFGTPPPKPFILNQEGHTHFIAPPNWPLD